MISSPKYAVPVLHKSDRLNNNIPFMRMTERDEKPKLATNQDIIFCDKDNVLPDKNCGLATFYGYNLNNSIIFLTWGISYILLLIVLM